MMRYDILSALLLGLTLSTPLAVIQYRRQVRFARIGAQCALLVYLVVVSAIVTSPIRQIAASDLKWFHSSVNLVPFATIRELLARDSATQAVRQILGNIVLFMPLGLLLPLFGGRLRSFGTIAAAGLGLSAAVELLQLLLWAVRLGTHSIDIDDLVLNTLGAVLGFAVWRIATSGATQSAPA